MDYRGIPIFPEYVNRRIECGDTDGFTLVAASSRELFEEPVKRLLGSAGFQVRE